MLPAVDGRFRGILFPDFRSIWKKAAAENFIEAWAKNKRWRALSKPNDVRINHR